MATEQAAPTAPAAQGSRGRLAGLPEPLQPGEYITDLAIERAEDDRFGHQDIVGQLAELALRGPGKTNVALFAPWGTGKSGIAKLLKAEIGTKARFAYFDAFKHRKTPLRRAFLRAVAEGVGVKAEDTDAYFKEKSRRVFDKSSRKTLFQFVGRALGIGILLMAVVAAGLALLKTPGQGKDYGDVFVTVLTNLGGVAAFIAAMIGVIAAASSEGLGYTETTTPPSEDDQFEDGFKSLIKGKGRVVVFIDELDRCSAGEVVETLETLRVFLDAEDCVFVVAADRRALEQALRNRARQETPFDESHPYFSSGSSYIDKIFQTQLSLPPVRARDMTEFAQVLVGEAPGTWATLREWGELDVVIAALIPTHVRAPRQVKVLLNAYLIAHRIATKRIDDGDMKPLEGRAAALAQLVCLQIEFPLLAEDLADFPELPRAIRARTADPPEDLHAEMPRTWKRAAEYLSLRAPLAPLIVKPQDQLLPKPRDPDSPSTDPESTPDTSGTGDGEPASSRPDGAGPTEPHTEADRSEATRIALRRLDNLRSYLARVRSLPGIERDLVYLHSAATTETELEPSTADRLDAAARDGDTAVLEGILSGLGPERQSDVITVLVGVLDDAKVAVDSENATRVLLATVEHLPELERGDADRVARAVGQATGDGALDEELRPNAVRLAACCSNAYQEKLLARVAPDRSIGDELREALLENAENLPAGHPALVRAVDLSISKRDAADHLGTLDSEVATRLAREGAKAFIERKPTYEPPAAPEGEEPAKIDQAKERAKRLGSFLDGLLDAQPGAAVEVAIAMLDGERTSANAVYERRERFAPITDSRLARAMLGQANRYRSAPASSILQTIDEAAVDRDCDPLIDQIAGSCLADALESGPEEDQAFQALLTHLIRLRGGREGATTENADERIAELAAAPAATTTESNLRMRLSANTRLLLDAGLADGARAASSFVRGAAASLRAIPDPAQPEQDPPAIARDIAQIVKDWAARADDESLREAVDAAVSCPANTDPHRVTVMLTAAAELRRRDASTAPPISVDDLVALATAHRAEAADPLAVWAEAFAGDADSIWRVLEPLWGPDEIPRQLRDAAAGAAKGLGESTEAELVGLAIDHALANTTITTHYSNWEAVGLQAASDAVITNLAGRISSSMSENEWSAILHVARQASEGHPKVQLQLGNELLVPLAKSDFELALRYLGLVGSENGLKIVEQLEGIAASDAERELLADRVKDLGWGGGRLQRFLDRFLPKPSRSDADPDEDAEE